jgi:isocitrate lyase
MNYQPRGISDPGIQGPASYLSEIGAAEALLKTKPTWDGVTAEAVARMRLQNRFKTGLDVARYTAALMRSDMAAYDADTTKYTQSLGCWHGFIAQQKLISVKKHFGTTDRCYLYLSGWMIAALRSEFGPLPDQSMHEKTSVPALIEELYTFLRQADSRELNDIFRNLDAARKAGDKAKEKALIEKIDTFQTHVVPVIADIDAGFGNAEATYLLAKKMIEAGACALQIENQVSDEKQCGHQDGKVTVPHEVFLAKIRACRHAFLELGVEDGVVVTRTDSLGAGLTQQIAVSHQQLISVPRRQRPGSLRARLHHLAAERCRPAMDRDREAEYRADRQDGRSCSRGDPERKAGLQQFAVVQLDAQLPLAGLRCDEGSRQGCQQVQPCRADEGGVRQHAAGDRSRRTHPDLPG